MIPGSRPLDTAVPVWVAQILDQLDTVQPHFNMRCRPDGPPIDWLRCEIGSFVRCCQSWFTECSGFGSVVIYSASCCHGGLRGMVDWQHRPHGRRTKPRQVCSVSMAAGLFLHCRLRDTPWVANHIDSRKHLITVKT